MHDSIDTVKTERIYILLHKEADKKSSLSSGHLHYRSQFLYDDKPSLSFQENRPLFQKHLSHNRVDVFGDAKMIHIKFSCFQDHFINELPHPEQQNESIFPFML